MDDTGDGDMGYRWSCAYKLNLEIGRNQGESGIDQRLRYVHRLGIS